MFTCIHLFTFIHVYIFSLLTVIHVYIYYSLLNLLLITPIVHLINRPLQPHLMTFVPYLVQEQGEEDVFSRESVPVPSTDLGTPAEHPLNALVAGAARARQSECKARTRLSSLAPGTT